MPFMALIGLTLFGYVSTEGWVFAMGPSCDCIDCCPTYIELLWPWFVPCPLIRLIRPRGETPFMLRFGAFAIIWSSYWMNCLICRSFESFMSFAI